MISRTDIRQRSLEAFANTDLVKEIGIFEDVGREILPLFLTATEQCSLASSSSSWEKLFHKRFTHIVEDWKKHPFLKSQMKMLLHTNQPFRVIKSLFSETDALKKTQPLAEKFGFTQELEEVTLEQFPDFIEDLNLVAFCEVLNFNDKPLKAADETLSRYAKQLRTWIKNTPVLTQVTVLNLRKNDLTVLPEEIGFFTGLFYLDLQDNKLNSLPDSIGKLTALRMLDVSRNALTILPNSLGDLILLQSLDLCDNKLRTLPKAIEELSALEMVFLSRNLIRSLPRSIGNLTLLKELELSFNQLTSLPNTLDKLKSLENLDLLNNHLRFFPHFILKLPHLKVADLSFNQLNVPPNILKNLIQRKILKLNFNPNRDARTAMDLPPNTPFETIAEH